MKKKAIIVLGPAELAGILREYPDRLLSNECFAITPDVYELSRSDERLKHFKYPEWVQKIRTFSVEDYKKIEKNLIKLEENSYKKRAEIFEEVETKVDWNYQSNYFLLTMILASRSFALQSFEELAKFDKVEICALAHPGEFYFDSCIQPALITHELRKRGIDVEIILLDGRAKAITHQFNLYESLPDLTNEEFYENWKNIEKFVFIATSAIYSKLDQQKLIQILNGVYSEAKKIVYPLPLWNTLNQSTIFDKKINLSELIYKINYENQKKCIAYANWLTDETQKTILDIIQDEEIILNPLFKTQINGLHKRHLFQSLTYIQINNVFQINKPEMIALTIQDSSINGPLASAAEIFGIPKFVFPHSHVINWRTQCECTIVTEWWQPVHSKTLWGQKNNAVYFDTPLILNKKNINEIKNCWMILYNGVQENVSNSVAWPFIQEIVSSVDKITKISDIKLNHRLKPGDQTPIGTFCELLNLNPITVLECLKGSLQGLLINTDVVISIDEPSSALWEALSMGCVVLLVCDRELTNESLSNNYIMPSLTIEEFKETIFSFVSDKNNFLEYREAQQKKLLEVRNQRIQH